MKIIAKNPKHQAMVNRCVKWLEKYNEFDRQRNIADSDGDEKLYNRLDIKCQDSFDKYLEYADELPKREKLQIEKSELY